MARINEASHAGAPKITPTPKRTPVCRPVFPPEGSSMPQGFLQFVVNLFVSGGLVRLLGFGAALVARAIV